MQVPTVSVRDCTRSGPETPIAGLVQGVRGKRLNQRPGNESILLNPQADLIELVLVVAVVHDHRVPRPDEAVLGKPTESIHSTASSTSMPVETSAEQLGHVAVAIIPTMNVKPHSGHAIFGIGASGWGGGGGGGGGPPPGSTPGPA